MNSEENAVPTLQFLNIQFKTEYPGNTNKLDGPTLIDLVQKNPITPQKEEKPSTHILESHSSCISNLPFKYKPNEWLKSPRLILMDLVYQSIIPAPIFLYKEIVKDQHIKRNEFYISVIIGINTYQLSESFPTLRSAEYNISILALLNIFGECNSAAELQNLILLANNTQKVYNRTNSGVSVENENNSYTNQNRCESIYDDSIRIRNNPQLKSNENRPKFNRNTDNDSKNTNTSNHKIRNVNYEKRKKYIPQGMFDIEEPKGSSKRCNPEVCNNIQSQRNPNIVSYKSSSKPVNKKVIENIEQIPVKDLVLSFLETINSGDIFPFGKVISYFKNKNINIPSKYPKSILYSLKNDGKLEKLEANLWKKI